MRLVIVTGMSGAGKSTALKMLEDMHYFCVDNLPIALIEKFAALMLEAGSEDMENAALGIDSRSGSLTELDAVFSKMRETGYRFEILFLDSEDAVLVKRYKETRRSHPLSKTGRVDEGIKLERQRMEPLRRQSDFILDTSRLLTRELKQELERIFVQGKIFRNMMVSIVSFGFKYGIPQDADLVFDVRFLPNPYYVSELRPLTGEDEAVYSYVMEDPDAQDFAGQLESMVRFLIPRYETEGKTSLVLAIGCTGGKHRSISMARELFKRLTGSEEYRFRLEHRDADRDRPARRGM